MAIAAIFTSLFGVIGSVFSGWFKVGEKKAEIVDTLIKTIGDSNTSAATRETAIATVIAAEAGSGNRLASSWRPLLMVIFGGIIVSFWFGYSPPGLNNEMPPMMAEIFLIIKIGISGYIPARTFEKIVDKLALGKVLQKLLERNGIA